MDNKHVKLFVIKQSEGGEFMPKMHAPKYLRRPAPPQPARQAYALRQTP